jgi:hypothetical protein
MNYITQTLSDFHDNPELTIRNLVQKPSFKIALTGYFIGSLSLLLWTSFPGGSGVFSILFMSVLVTFLSMGTCLVAAAFIHFFLDVGGHKGRLYSLFVIFGIAESFKIVLVPISLLSSAFGGFASISILSFFVVKILQLFFVVYAIRRAYFSSMGATLLAISAPVIFLFGLFFILAIFIATALAVAIMAVGI